LPISNKYFIISPTAAAQEKGEQEHEAISRTVVIVEGMNQAT